MSLIFSVIGNVLTLTNASQVVAGEVNVTDCVFNFDSAWEGYTKTVVFQTTASNATPVILDPDVTTCDIPPEVIALKKVLYVGVIGVLGGSVLNTNWETWKMVSGANPNFIPAPTEEIYLQVVGIMQAQKVDAETATAQAVIVTNKASEALQSASEAATSETKAKQSEVNAKASEDIVETLHQDIVDNYDTSALAPIVAEHTTQLAQNATQINANKSMIAIHTSQITGLASGSPKGVYATLADLQTTYPSGDTNTYIVSADGNWYYWSGSAWTAGGTYQDTRIADNSVRHFSTDFLQTGKNIFNKDTIVSGYYVQFSTGNIIASANFGASDYIHVLPSTDYYMNYANQLAYYDASKTYISGKSATGNTFTTPSNAAYIRVTLELIRLEYLQIESGTSGTDYEPWGYKIDMLKPTGETLERIVNIEGKANLNRKRLISILDALRNPFVKTKIKIIGDSITAGQGGTGYTATGEAIGTTGYYANVTTATCWANMLKSNIESNFNRYVYVGLEDDRIDKIGDWTLSYNANTKLGTRLYFKNVSSSYLRFTFYGDKFSIIAPKYGAAGILAVYLDGAIVGNLDLYSSVFTWSTETEYATTLGTHTVEIRETNTKNASSTSVTGYLEAIRIPKVATVKNWGISGIGSVDLYNNESQLIETDDDIVIMQIGTNDRVKCSIPEKSKELQRQVIKYIEGLGKTVINMSSLPASATNESNEVYNFHMTDVDRMISELMAEYDREYVSNFQYFKQYCAEQNIAIDTLLGDGLHPTDMCYDLMYHNICRCLGLPQ